MVKSTFNGNEKTKERKRRFYEVLQNQLGNVTATERITNIDRTTHYKWMEKDEVYRDYVNRIEEITHDFVENALLKKIKEGDTTSIIFYLKTKAKDRGYVEKRNIEQNYTIDVNEPRQILENVKEEVEKAKQEQYKLENNNE